ncbi:ParB N-terminal domain-containing protein [Phaeobacter sp. HF9A]|uniref:ParB/RepB/Spo0J family partition protein n=1 Tax=Phaeobacter sp. HF9A TaxID=2721561 RepID=UPI0014312892|nr:ParB N-terminal domain-containing protein [Phaeobacter sp. HF9A]NIZ13218.1 ParB N-terminal domain-containing protein [Phaeobacter sp. HF9A]
MAKRKRLTPAQPTYLSAAERAAATPSPAPGLSKGVSVGAAPIAQVASDTAAAAALEELSGVLENARARGLMITEIPLEAIDETYLVRDRVVQNEEDMLALMASIHSRGQQTPIEVVALEQPQGGHSHGLISGWRRLTALRRLAAETPDPVTTVKALIVTPASAADAYLSMVEENEIRVNLSHYERARIAMRALEEGVFPDQRKALLGLFGNVSRAKRSKIASFVTLVSALDEALRFPTAIPEKLGLGLAHLLEKDPSFGPHLLERLRASAPADAVEEMTVLNGAMTARNMVLNERLESDKDVPAVLRVQPPAPVNPPQAAAPSPVQMPPRSQAAAPLSSERVMLNIAPGLRLSFAEEAGTIELSGEAVTADLMTELKVWLSRR